jgi:hypothetical protein
MRSTFSSRDSFETREINSLVRQVLFSTFSSVAYRTSRRYNTYVESLGLRCSHLRKFLCDYTVASQTWDPSLPCITARTPERKTRLRQRIEKMKSEKRKTFTSKLICISVRVFPIPPRHNLRYMESLSRIIRPS